MTDLAPNKSKAIYEKAWNDFNKFLASEMSSAILQDDGLTKTEPGEDDYIRYFHYLKKNKEFKASSLWSTYSHLNNVHRRIWGIKLQKRPRITMLLKNHESGYVRSAAKAFTKDEILQIMQIDNTTNVWVLRKAAIAIAYCGGLRCVELHSIKYGNLTLDNEGVWVMFQQAKQRGEVKENRFLVPFNREKPHRCFAARVMTYLCDLTASLVMQPNDDLFRKCLKSSGFGKQPMHRSALLGQVWQRGSYRTWTGRG